MIHGITMHVAKGRKLGTPYEIREWRKKKFAPRDGITNMQIEEEFLELKLEIQEDPKIIMKKITGVLVKCHYNVSRARRVSIALIMGKGHYSTVLIFDTVMTRTVHKCTTSGTKLVQIMSTKQKMKRGVKYKHQDVGNQTTLGPGNYKAMI